MSHYIIDVESDGPTPATSSMVCFGAVKILDPLDITFYGQTAPVSEHWSPDALAISGFTREQHQEFDDPQEVMIRLAEWISETNIGGRPIFWSDNLAFDWMWIAYYFDLFGITNPFGWSGRRIGDVFSGQKNDSFVRWKHLRKTVHDHNPVNDARGNAEVMLLMKENGYKIKLR